ncbi:MAG TPA: hypothetical protein VLT61_02720 [Anaeromyxobacteraceae bacterium]|nr:hypothetical protein [Anaeromyxobacteraceae bacterium]
MRIHPLLVSGALLLAAGARADTVDVTSTTLLDVGKQTRGGVPGSKPDLVTTAPAYEILSIVASDIRNPIADDLQIVLGTWGSLDAGDRRWDAGTTSSLNGDVQTGYISARLIARRLTLRVGREHVAAGVARMIQIDGGEAVLALPLGLRLSGYAGVPVSQRFASRGRILSWNPMGGDLAYGGRAGWTLALPGVAGRGLDVGASANVVKDGDATVREEVGADIRVVPATAWTVTGFGTYSTYDARLSEATVRVGCTAVRKLLVEADWRFLAPDLLLARNSILSVFSDEKRNLFGLGATYQLRHGLSAGGSYHLQLEPGEDPEKSYSGHEAEARIDWERGATLAGLEASYVDAYENGYVAGRVYGRHDMGRWFAAVDLIAHHFRDKINEQSGTLTGTLTAGVKLATGFSAVVSGRAGTTPFLEQAFDVMAKLVYNQTYRIREVR